MAKNEAKTATRTILLLLTLLPTYSALYFKLPKAASKRCFVVRSQFAKTFVTFSYIVQSDILGGETTHLVVTNRDTKEIIYEVKPESNSSQRIFRYENDGKSVYNVCFTNPNEFATSVKFFVDSSKRELLVEKDKLSALNRMAGEMKDAATVLEDQLFVSYLNLKYTEEALSHSQRFLHLACLLKLLVLLLITALQFYWVAKMFGKLNMTLGSII